MIISDRERQDSMDMPECFGEFSKNNKLCFSHCAMSIRCCIMRSRHPKMDILEKLLIHNHYAVKPH
jgi:hypothetical protein